MARSSVSPVTSGDRKRSLSSGVHETNNTARRLTSDYHSSMSMPGPSYGTSSYPISHVYYPSQRDEEVDHNSSQSRSSSSDFTYHRGSSNVADSNDTKANTIEGHGYPTSVTGFTGPGYPGQYDFNKYPCDAGWRNDSPPSTNRNRFNLSRYQLDEDEDMFSSLGDQSAVTEEVKPNRFKTQRERLMLARRQESEEDESEAAAREDEEELPSSSISQRERLRLFCNEQSHHVVIPNQWEGEKNLHEFVAFGNIEAALRPLGLIMARTALVNDSVTTRHHHHRSSTSTGPTSSALPAHS